MKRYLLLALILVVTGAFATSAYADWAEISESSSQDAEFFGAGQAEQAKQISDVKLRQLSEEAESLATTSIASTTTAAISVENLNTQEPALGLVDANVGSAGDDAGANNPPGNDPGSNPEDSIIFVPDAVEDSIPVIPADPEEPILDPDSPVISGDKAAGAHN